MALVQIYFELLNLIPMPWQVSAFIFFSALFLYWAFYLGKLLIALIGRIGMKLTEWGARLLLLPEFLITSIFRVLRLKSAPGAGIYDDFVEAVGGGVYKLFEAISKVQTRELHYPTRWILLAMIIPIVAWYLRQSPDLQGSLFAQYVDQGFGMYYSMQYRLLSR